MWNCHHCSTSALDGDGRCPSCGAPRTRSSRAGGGPIPEQIAIQQCMRLKYGNGENTGYSRWTEEFGAVADAHHQLVLNMRVEPPGMAEPEEMKQLGEWGWVKIGPGHYQRELERTRVITFDETGKVRDLRF